MKKLKSLSVPALAVLMIAVTGCERKITNEAGQDGLAASTCFTCHGDQNFELVAAQQQWANSKHASGDNIDKGARSSCGKCHANEGFVAEVTGGTVDGEHFTTISCFTCHAPHTNGNLNLRVTAPVTLGDGEIFDRGPANLCASCHQSRRDVNTYVYAGRELSSHFGPHHSNQADMLVATGGYEYAGFGKYHSSAHAGSATKGCIDCHMTGSAENVIGGHAFYMENEEREIENLTGCNVDECHGITGKLTELNRLADADFDGDGATEGVQDEIEGLVHELRDLLLAAGLIEEDEDEPGEFDPTDDLVVPDKDSVGAVYNYKFVEEDRSGGVHNTDYAVELLQSSINFIKTGSPNGIAPRPKKDMLAAH